MKKAEIIKLLREHISSKYPQPVVKKAILDIVNEFLAIVKEELNKGEDIRIPNFGTFRIKEVKKEGEEVKKVIRFIPSKS